MLENCPDPNEDYEDWEYPDPEDIRDLANLPLDHEPSSPRGPRISILLRAAVGLMLLGFILPVILPVLGPSAGNGDLGASPGNSIAVGQAYQQWIEHSVSSVVAGDQGAGEIRFLGVQFGDSIRDPVIGMVSEGGDLRSGSIMNDLQRYSITVLRNLFADERAESVTLVWLGPTSHNGGGEPLRDIILPIGMLRQTAKGIDWTGVEPADLRDMADYYQERPTTEEASI